MINKIAENCMIVEDCSIAGTIKSLSYQIFTTKTTFFSKSANMNKRRAFSVAEAFIVLLVGSIALGMSAPMITKQIKFQNMTDAQVRLINDRNQDLREEMAELRARIEELENTDNSGIPEEQSLFLIIQ